MVRRKGRIVQFRPWIGEESLLTAVFPQEFTQILGQMRLTAGVFGE